MTRALWRADAAHVAALAAPLVLTQLAQVALGTTNVVMLGQLDTVDLAAGGLAMSLFNLFRTMGVGLVTPTGNLVAEATVDAASGPQRIRELSRASFALATVAGLAAWLLLTLCAPVLRLAGQDSHVVERCALYLAAAAPGMVPLLWFQVLRNITVGLRRPGPLLVITLGSVALNAALAFALMTGAWGLPALGLLGVGLSGTLVNGAAFAAFLWVVRHDRQVAVMTSLMIWAVQWQPFSRTLKLGLPIAATYGSEAAFFSILGLLAGSFGPAALAAHTVVNQVVYVVFMVAVGLSHAVSISISPAWAQRDGRRTRRLAWTGLAMGWLAMSAVAMVYLAAPDLVLAAFLQRSGSGVAQLAGSLLGIAALLQFFDCSQNIALGMLRGVGETGSAFVRTLVGYWLVGLPLAWWLGLHWQLGVIGLWLGLAAGLAATAAQLLLRFFRITAAERALRAPKSVVEGSAG